MRHRTKKLRDLFNDMDVVKARNGVDDLVRGMLIEPAEKIDNTFADVSTNKMRYQNPQNQLGRMLFNVGDDVV